MWIFAKSVDLIILYLSWNLAKDCSSKFRSRHSTVLLLCLLRNLLEQSLIATKIQNEQYTKIKSDVHECWPNELNAIFKATPQIYVVN